MAASSRVPVNLPRTFAPGVNVPSPSNPNQRPNSSASASARQTLESGARRVIRFSILSLTMCNLRVALYARRGEVQPGGCTRVWPAGTRPVSALGGGSASEPQGAGLDAEVEAQLDEQLALRVPGARADLVDAEARAVKEHQPVFLRQAAVVRVEPDPLLAVERNHHQELSAFLQDPIEGPELKQRSDAVFERVASGDEVEGARLEMIEHVGHVVLNELGMLAWDVEVVVG